MAKTNPIGVRFDQDLLNALAEDKIADTPQKVLNFLTNFYRENKKGPDFVKMFESSKLFKPNEGIMAAIKKSNPKPFKHPTLKEVKDSLEEPMPVRKPGEDALDFAERKNEWKRLYQK